MKTTLRNMGGLFCAMVLTLFSLHTFAQNTPEVLYYKFDGTGTTVPNLATAPPAGTATATLMGGITQGSTGQCGGAIIGSGVSSTTDFLNTGWAPDLGTGSWTISFWSSGISTNPTLYYVFGDATAGSFRCFTNGVAGSGNYILRGGGLTDVLITGAAQMTPTLVTFVYDQPMAQVRGYLNGVLANTVAQGAVNIIGTGPFKVMGYGTNVGSPAGGLIDEFRVYSHALTQTEIDDLVNVYLSTSISITACDSYTWASNGQTYTTSGTYTDTIVNPSACDTIVTLDLTINNTVETIDTVVTCDTYFWAQNNTTYTTSGYYSDTIFGGAVTGCDSIVSLDLTVLYATSATVTESACDAFVWPLNGMSYTASGVYFDTIPNAAGCDSIITLDLTINTTSYTIDTVVSCNAYTWSVNGQTYMNSGMYMDTLIASTGCDSIFSLELTILPVPTVTVTDNGDATITATGGGTYQWIDCATNQPIAGETAATYAPSVNGSYAVEVTNNNGCTATSSCTVIDYIAVGNFELSGLVVAPNPFDQSIRVTFDAVEADVIVVDLDGRLVYENRLTSGQEVQLNELASGTYLLKIKTNTEFSTLTIVKK